MNKDGFSTKRLSGFSAAKSGTTIVFTILLIIVISVLWSSAWALQGTTQKDYIACFNKSDLDDIIMFVSVKDIASMDSYLKQRKCIMLADGLTVTVTKPPGMFGGYAEFVFRGVKLWTVREALRNYR